MALGGVWAVGFLAMMLRAAGGWVVLWRARLASAHFEPHFQNGDGAEVRIANVSTPLTCGVFAAANSSAAERSRLG